MSTRVDPRVERTRRTVVAAAAELLADEGFERVTIDAIAERSGVARSTVYRNWEDRAGLLVEAFRVVCDLPDIPDHGDLVADFTFLGRHLAEGLAGAQWGAMLPSLVGASAHDPDLRRALRDFTRTRRAVAVELVDRARARDEIGAGVDAERAVERFAAPFFFRRLVEGGPLDAAFVDDQVARLVADLGGRR